MREIYLFMYRVINAIKRFFPIQKRIYLNVERDFKTRIDKIGGGKLTVIQVNSAMEFFAPYYTIALTSHQFYTNATDKFYPNYLPDSLHYGYIDTYFNDWDMAKYMDNKCLYRNMFPVALQPKTIVYRMNGFWYNGTDNLLILDEAIKQILQQSPCFIKLATDSYGGRGVRYVDSYVSEENLVEILNDLKSDIIVQEEIKQSKTLSEINPSSVNTIRLVTLLHKNGDVKMYSAILRMGIKGAKVDNASSGGITVGIDANGRLKDIAFSKYGDKYFEHPTSHVRFSDYTIPNYDKVKQLVCEQAKFLPHFRLLSWDIALDENDLPIIVEVNLCNGELDFHQLNNGPLFGDDTKEILDEVFHGRKF